MSESFFHSLMNPKSIAIVGASNNPSKMGTMHALSILKDGYKGKFFPVHPTEKTVLGHPAYLQNEDPKCRGCMLLPFFQIVKTLFRA